MKKTGKDQVSKSDAERERIREEFDRVMNTPSPNPRYGGRTPMELLKMLLNTRKRKPAS